VIIFFSLQNTAPWVFICGAVLPITDPGAPHYRINARTLGSFQQVCARLVVFRANFSLLEGRPNPDRTWTECFAQLVGTVLSYWDAAELDAAGDDGEVLPKFINLTDASIKMVASPPLFPPFNLSPPGHNLENLN
jgi:hypothetical protein